MLGILIYELLVGVSPYHDNEKEILKDNILKAPLRIPKFISPEAKDIIIKACNYQYLVITEGSKEETGKYSGW